MKYLNEILKNTGYYYKEVTKQRYIIKYELVRPNIEIIVNGEDRLITYNYLEKIWDYDGGRKLTFVDDDDE